MHPPLAHRLHIGGVVIPALGGRKAQVGPLRVSAPVDIIPSENKEAAKCEDGALWFDISTWKIFSFFYKCVVALACAGALVFLCHLGITHYNSVSYTTSICISISSCACFQFIMMQYVYVCRCLNF